MGFLLYIHAAFSPGLYFFEKYTVITRLSFKDLFADLFFYQPMCSVSSLE